jgi:hypothetical protein
MRTSTNGTPRKTLESQIDRLDRILDGLANALQEAVTTAVKEGVSQVVREALREFVPGVMVDSAGHTPAAGSRRLLTLGLSSIAAKCRVATQLMGTGLRWLWAQRTSILFLLVIGLGVGWLTSAGSPLLVAVASGVGALTFMLAVWWRQHGDSPPHGRSRPEALNHQPPRNRVFADNRKSTEVTEAMDGQ